MATIKDIAKRAGVSVATVSYVINNTRWVHEDKRRRVMEAIRELNYVPNAVARGLRVQKSNAISLIVSDITNPFYPDIARACQEAARARGCTVNIVNTDDSPEKMSEALKQLRGGKADGAVITSALPDNREEIGQLLKEGYPVVLASRTLDDLEADSVVADNRQGAMMAVNYLVGLGHRKIAFVNGVEGSWINKTRTEGYLQAMEEAGLPVLPEWLVSGKARYEASYQAARALLSLPKDRRPTAILNLTDLGAFGVLDAAKDMGVAVPDDLAVIGFDDLFYSGLRNIQLTTIRIPRHEMGRLATEMLFERMENKDAEPRSIVMPVELVVRKTCGGAAR
jgi:LacI family transcriptional regulator